MFLVKGASFALARSLESMLPGKNNTSLIRETNHSVNATQTE
jgi:hypothetical protein